MLVISSIDEFNSKAPCILTIGTFDGFHLGHQKIFEQMTKESKKHKKVIITFDRAPQNFISQKTDKPLIRFDTKLEFFKKSNIDIVIALKFTDTLSSFTYLDFLKDLKQKINFTHLILGKDAAFGYRKEGIENNVKLLETLLNFKAIYIPKFKQNNLEISSTVIKDLIQKGELSVAKLMLGRHFEIYPNKKELHLSQDQTTLLIVIDDIILPPSGKYLFKINESNVFFEGEIKKTQIEIRINDKINFNFNQNCSIKIQKCL